MFHRRQEKKIYYICTHLRFQIVFPSLSKTILFQLIGYVIGLIFVNLFQLNNLNSFFYNEDAILAVNQSPN